MSAPTTDARAPEPHPLEVRTLDFGSGRDIVFLSDDLWIADERPFVERLASLGHVIAPVHPGFDDLSEATPLSSVDELSYLYLDLIENRCTGGVILVGAGFGGWIALMLAVKSCQDVAGLVLIDSFGLKFGERSEREIVDVFGVPDAKLRELGYANPAPFEVDMRTLEDAELARRVRAREALARYGWSPYMHTPRLQTLLHRVRVPALVLWGARDGIASPDYGRKIAAALPDARFELIEDAGHYPHLEQPTAVLQSIERFTRERASLR